MSNPLIATVDEGNAAGGLLTNMKDSGNGYWAGTGIFYDAKSTLDDARKGDWLGLGIDVAADGLDALGLLMDPFGVLLSAPIGWIIEHISFLKEPLDLVAGDPDQVRAKAGTWTNIAAALEKSAADYRQSAEALQQGGFTGAAASAYVKAAGNYCGAVDAAGGHARDAAKAIEVAGAIVGTVRGTIRDLISQFCADALIKGLAALALSFETFGASVAAWVADTVFEASSLAARLAAKITKVVQEVKQLVTAARRSLTALDDAGRDLSAGARSAERSAARDTAGAAYRAAAQRSGQVEHNLAAAERRVAQAHTELAAAQSRLAAAHTPRQQAAAERDIARAQDHVDRYAQQAQRWHDELAQQESKADKALEDYRDSYKNEDGPISETTHGRLDHGKEAAMQGKESRADSAERGEASEESTAELDDGSLVETGE